MVGDLRFGGGFGLEVSITRKKKRKKKEGRETKRESDEKSGRGESLRKRGFGAGARV